jgi:hypothetical protein
MTIEARYIDGLSVLPALRPNQPIEWKYIDGVSGGDLATVGQYTAPTIAYYKAITGLARVNIKAVNGVSVSKIQNVDNLS